MKKAGVVIIAIVYFAVTSGIIVNLHYCMNRFASADFGISSSPKECGKCGMHKEQSHGCCHDEVKLVKLQDDQHKSMQVAFDFSTVTTGHVIPSLFLVASFYAADKPAPQQEYAPPLLKPQDVCVQHCVFRI